MRTFTSIFWYPLPRRRDLSFLFQESEYHDRTVVNEALTTSNAEGVAQGGSKYPERKLVGILLVWLLRLLQEANHTGFYQFVQVNFTVCNREYA